MILVQIQKECAMRSARGRVETFAVYVGDELFARYGDGGRVWDTRAGFSTFGASSALSVRVRARVCLGVTIENAFLRWHLLR